MDQERLRQREVLEKFARAVADRHMALAFVEPMLRLVLDAPDYTVFREAIEDRENVRWLVDRLEELERGEE